MNLITGASGFIGGRLAEILAGNGERVRVLARQTSDLGRLANLPVEVVHGSLRDEPALEAAVRDVAVVYHCAACSTDWAPSASYFEANVEGVRNLLTAASHSSKLVRFLQVSTTDVYGYPHQPCDESHPLEDTGLPYNRTKALGEEQVWEAWRRSGLPVTIVRPATVYGPHGKAFTSDIARLICQGSMAVIDGGAARGGFSYVDNVAHGIMQAAASHKTIGQAYNLADETGATWKSYVDCLADGLGRRRPWINISSSIAMPLARTLEALHRQFSVLGRPLLTRHAVLLLSRDQEYPIEKAKRDFDYSPAVSFGAGIEESVRWLRSQPGVKSGAPSH